MQQHDAGATSKATSTRIIARNVYGFLEMGPTSLKTISVSNGFLPGRPRGATAITLFQKLDSHLAFAGPEQVRRLQALERRQVIKRLVGTAAFCVTQTRLVTRFRQLHCGIV